MLSRAQQRVPGHRAGSGEIGRLGQFDVGAYHEGRTCADQRFLRFPDACFCCLSENTPAGLIFQSDLSENRAESQFIK